MPEVLRGRFAAAVLLAVIFGPAVRTTLPQLLDGIRSARSLATLPLEERRTTVFGSWYTVVLQVRRTIRQDAPVDIVMATPDARDVAVFAGAALAPRPCRFFLGWDGWRRRERATFFHDERAVNAPPGPPPNTAAAVLLVVDPRLEPPIRLVPLTSGAAR